MPTSTDEVEALRKRLQRDAAMKRAKIRERRLRLRAKMAFSPYQDVDKLVDTAGTAVRKELLGEPVHPAVLIHLSDELLALAAENVESDGAEATHEVATWLLARARERLQGA